MSRARRNGYRCIAVGLAWMSVLACNSDTDEKVAGGQPCQQSDQCEDGWVCYQEVCRQVCNDHRECAKTEACEPGVCVPVANYECDEDADCNEPTGCESILDAECYAGQCHYSPLAEGLPCDDDNKCTRNDLCDAKGTCSGEAMKCETPPPNFCSQDDTVFTRYESTGTCNPATGSCECDYEDIACTDCERSCLDLPVAPRNLVATAGDAQVTLTWEAIDGALSYNVYVSQTAGETASAEPVSDVSSPYARTGLENGIVYYFAVSAVTEVGEGLHHVLLCADSRGWTERERAV